MARMQTISRCPHHTGLHFLEISVAALTVNVWEWSNDDKGSERNHSIYVPLAQSYGFVWALEFVSSDPRPYWKPPRFRALSEEGAECLLPSCGPVGCVDSG